VLLRRQADGLDQTGAATAVAAAVLLTWPYYSIFDLRAMTPRPRIHLVLRSTLASYGLAGSPSGTAACFQRRRRDPLVLLFLTTLIVVGLGWLTGRAASVVGRTAGSQLALAVEIAELLNNPVPPSPDQSFTHPWLALVAYPLLSVLPQKRPRSKLPRRGCPTTPLQRLHGAGLPFRSTSAPGKLCSPTITTLCAPCRATAHIP
jgi:hypothetical protein